MNVPSPYIINTAEESKILDSKTSQEFGIDTFTLMEIAGFSTAKRIWKLEAADVHGLFLCGKGNNGGDALVAARYLAQCGHETTILFVNGTDDLSPLAQKNVELLKNIQENDTETSISFINSWADLVPPPQPDFIVDGMLGTGLNSDLRGDILKAVQWVNDQKLPCYSMDIPTGLHADSGKVLGDAVKATHTFSFGTLKQGYYLNEGYPCTGEIHFCELPFPNYLKKNSTTFLMDESWLPKKNRTPAGHKYEAGVVYIIGGSEGLTGAAMMAAKSAWAAGVGAVILICPKGLLPIYENNLPQIIKKPVGDNKDKHFKKSHLDEIIHITREKEGITLIGPGIGCQKDTLRFVYSFLGKNTTNCVIDADALWALAHQKKDWGKPADSSWILTPHPGELNTLIGKPTDDDLQRFNEIKKLTANKDVTVLSKGFPVMLGTPDGEIYLSGYDNRSFSRAGFGDVLAGKIAADFAFGGKPAESCIRALVTGKLKMDELQRQNLKHVPEPQDFL